MMSLTDHHLIIIKLPERFPKSDGHSESMDKVTLNEPAINYSLIIK